MALETFTTRTSDLGLSLLNQDGVVRAHITEKRSGFHPGAEVHVEEAGWLIAFCNRVRAGVLLPVSTAASTRGCCHYRIGGTLEEAVAFAIAAYEETISAEDYRANHLNSPLLVSSSVD